MMEVTELHPSAVIDDFPSQGETVRQLFRKDKTFQAICADYQQCSRALQYWKNSDLPDAPKRRKEYKALLSELGDEISLILNDTNTSKKNDCQPDL